MSTQAVDIEWGLLPKQIFLIRRRIISKRNLLIFILRMTHEKDIMPKLMAGSKCQKIDSSVNMHPSFLCL